MSSRRAARVAERIREEASTLILFELRDPRIEFVTVTKVDLSSDLRHAKIFVSVLGDEAKRRTALRGLASARGLVRSRIAQTLDLREAPEITFEYDSTIEESIALSRLIDEAPRCQWQLYPWRRSAGAVRESWAWAIAEEGTALGRPAPAPPDDAETAEQPSPDQELDAVEDEGEEAIGDAPLPDDEPSDQ